MYPFIYPWHLSLEVAQHTQNKHPNAAAVRSDDSAYCYHHLTGMQIKLVRSTCRLCNAAAQQFLAALV